MNDGENTPPGDGSQNAPLWARLLESPGTLGIGLVALLVLLLAGLPGWTGIAIAALTIVARRLLLATRDRSQGKTRRR